MGRKRDGLSVDLWMPKRIWGLVKEAARRDRDRPARDLVRHYVLEGLRRDGLLGEGETA